MSDLRDLLDAIEKTPGCAVLPPAGQPSLRPGCSLPPDLQEFYDLAGGVTLFNVGGWANRIVAPKRFVQADEVLYGKNENGLPEGAWYAIADVQDGNYLLIDLHPSRAGRCYDAFHETYREPGYMKVVALSFTEMLERLYRHGSNQSYWLEEHFISPGDAYNPIHPSS